MLSSFCWHKRNWLSPRFGESTFWKQCGWSKYLGRSWLFKRLHWFQVDTISGKYRQSSQNSQWRLSWLENRKIDFFWEWNTLFQNKTWVGLRWKQWRSSFSRWIHTGRLGFPARFKVQFEQRRKWRSMRICQHIAVAFGGHKELSVCAKRRKVFRWSCSCGKFLQTTRLLWLDMYSWLRVHRQ